MPVLLETAGGKHNLKGCTRFLLCEKEWENMLLRKCMQNKAHLIQCPASKWHTIAVLLDVEATVNSCRDGDSGWGGCPMEPQRLLYR